MSKPQSKLVPVQVFQDFSLQVLEKYGVPREDAEVLTDTLVQASLRGHDSHGVATLPMYVRRLKSGIMKAKTTVTVLKEDASTALLDGCDGIGQVVAYRAMELAIRKAQGNGIGLVGVRNGGHFGAAAYFSMMALKHDLIGLTATNGYARMAPWGGYERIMCNTPWSVAIPAAEEMPVVLDMANSIVAYGKVRVAADKGEGIPIGWALTADGILTEDAREAMDGTVLPIGDYKGYGMAVIIEVLAAILTGALSSWDVGAPGNPEARSGVGHIIGAIDIERFVPLDEFKQRVDELSRKLRQSRKRPGFDAIRLPGEPEWITKQEREAKGIPTLQIWIDSLRDLGKEGGVVLPVE
jgi:LDH2 family malate/lactate/ureidoglycolate dehydrogenase